MGILSKSPRCPNCNTKMSVYRYTEKYPMMFRLGGGGKVSLAFPGMQKVLAIANCPKCYQMKEIMAEEEEK